MGVWFAGFHNCTKSMCHVFWGEDGDHDKAQLVRYWHSCGDPPVAGVDSIDRINLKSMQPWPLVKQWPRLNPSLWCCSLSITAWHVFEKPAEQDKPIHSFPVGCVEGHTAQVAGLVCSSAESLKQTIEQHELFFHKNNTILAGEKSLLQMNMRSSTCLTNQISPCAFSMQGDTMLPINAAFKLLIYVLNTIT